MKNTILTIGLAILLSPLGLVAQVGINTVTPNASSSLDIESVDSGILIPRMTEAQKNAIASPVKGLLIFQNNAEEGFWYFDGSIWILIGGRGEFISESGVIHSTTDVDNDDFVVGSTTLDNVSGTADDKRMFFDKAKAAFRVGSNTGTSWDNVNLGSFSMATGLNSNASASYAIAMGLNCNASASYAIAMGLDSNASGLYSVAMGRGNTSSGAYAVAIGRSNTITSEGGASLGYINTVSGNYATTFGRGNTASGTNAIAGVTASIASGENSIALGRTSKSLGENAITLGRLNDAENLNSVAIGFTNKARANGAFAVGNENNVRGDNAMAYGNNLTAPSFSEVAVGLYNTAYMPFSSTASDDFDRVFSVGNGFRQGGVTTFSNAMTILKNGNTGIGVEQPKEKLEVNGTIQATDINFTGLPTFLDEAAATSLETGDLYQTPGGEIRIKQ